ncbi:PREDICTED: SPARC-related modular calcium-binding protein 1-like [Priapulus caudatus]|uniref:SPARC-related modular calcium-binding protein 1-like n=1 Tax=Priapulus caudatus TaxID=37621 RepID=A0ABM1EM07_PRICU|nr:PREDICTED: SPARC-related modular calcium-binding protein 1-like [Priapulus caudatus]
MSKCQMHREMALSAPPVLMFDIWIPKCSLFDGSYETEQCTNDGRCFCTERNGKTIAGSETKGRMPQCNSIPDASPGANVIQDNNWIPITH